MEQFREGRDPYAELASKIFYVPADVIHKKGQRTVTTPSITSTSPTATRARPESSQPGMESAPRSSRTPCSVRAFSLTPTCRSMRLWRSTPTESTALSTGLSLSFGIPAPRVLSVLASYRASGEHYWCLQFGRNDMLIAMMDKIPCTEQWEPCVVLPNGFRMWYPNLRVTDDGLVYDRVIHGKATPTRIYGGLLTENICQALAFDMLYWQAVRIHRHGIEIKANIHDCWIAVVPDDRAEADAKTMESVMRTVPTGLRAFQLTASESGHDFTIA